MTLRRLWDPFRELDSIRRHLDVAFQDFYGRPSWPRLNISIDDENVYVEALTPGLDAESINVEIVRNTLTISGERKAFEKSGEETSSIRTERATGRFTLQQRTNHRRN